MTPHDLSRALLLSHDPRGGDGPVDGKRYACPLEGCAGKPVDMAHRSLSVNADTGAWNCWRCHATGLLVEYRGQDYLPSASTFVPRRKASVWQPVDLAAPQPKVTLDSESRERLRSAIADCKPILSTDGATYIEQRGIDAYTADACGARYHPDWLGGGKAIVFAARDERGSLVAAQGRFLDPRKAPKAMSIGKISLGVFATPGALDATFVAITEAPIDALSLAMLGCSAIALFGTNAAPWLRRRLAFTTVLIATDSDAPGEAAAGTLRQILMHGTRCERLTLPSGAKDVNEALLRDPMMLDEAVVQAIRRDNARFFPNLSESPLLYQGAV